MKQTILLFLFLSSITLMEAQTLFQIKSTYHHDYQCPHEIAGDPNAKNRFQNLGTGFLWKEQYVVTAYHTLSTHCGSHVEVVDPEGTIHEAEVLGTETLLDVALLKLCKPFPQFKSAALGTVPAQPGMAVEILGRRSGTYEAQKIATTIEATDVCMPGCFGSHRLALTTKTPVPKGYSGGPVVANGKVIGMAVAQSKQDQKGYVLDAKVLAHTLDELLKYDRVRRPFLGGVWQNNARGIRLNALLTGAHPSLNPFVGQTLTHVNQQAVSDLIALRTYFEAQGYDKLRRLSLSFINIAGHAQTIELEPEIYSVLHSEAIANFFAMAKVLPFQLQKNTEKACVEEGYGSHQIFRGDCLEAVSISQIESGIHCEDVFDLGLVLRTFSPTQSELTFHFNTASARTSVVKNMVGILIL